MSQIPTHAPNMASETITTMVDWASSERVGQTH